MLFPGAAFAGVYLNTEGFLSALESAKSFTEHPHRETAFFSWEMTICFISAGSAHLPWKCRVSRCKPGQPILRAVQITSYAKNNLKGLKPCGDERCLHHPQNTWMYV